MTWIHAESVTITGEAHVLSLWVPLVVLGGGLLTLHVVRAVTVHQGVAEEWMRRRNLPYEQRAVTDVLAYLRRLRWSRVASTALLIGVCAASLAEAKAWVSFVSLPFLLSVLGAEALAPDPRRGRVRVALLLRRARGFYAPRVPLAVARLAIGLGALLSIGAYAFRDTRTDAPALVHGLVMLTGAVALELCLQRSAQRALPDRQPDAAVDTAMRVASARTATAAALVFGMFGLFLSVSFSGLADSLGPTGRAMLVLNQGLTFSMLIALAVALNLVQPLASWQPRGTK